MNNQLIRRVIQSNNESSSLPDFAFENPLLDKGIAKELSRSFVKILSISQQNPNVNNNLRHSILANIRNMCRVEPENHLKIDDSFTGLLSEFYVQHIKDLQTTDPPETVDRSLDVFLMRRMKELNLSSNYQSSVSPEVVQSLINLNENKVYLEMLSRDIMHWNMENKNLNLLKNLWKDTSLGGSSEKSYIVDAISIKMKPEIERLLLDVCYSIFGDSDSNFNEIFTNNSLNELIKTCSVSPDCFQISCGILNFVFIMTNFDSKMQLFVPKFVSSVKQNCNNTISVLYPVHVSHIVVLLDFDIDGLPLELKHKYIQPTVGYLKDLHYDSENDFVMLLSHYPQWFSIYFEQKATT